MKDLLICIGNTGSYDHLGACLRSIFAEQAVAFDYGVVVGFNGVADRSVIDRVRAEFPQVRSFYRPEKLGYTGTYNVLLRAAKARYTLILDDDTVVPQGTLPAMVAFMDAHPEVGLSGCRTLSPDGTFQKTYGVFSNLRSELEAIVRPASLWPARIYRDMPDWKLVDWIDGSFLLVRREALDVVGGLDEYYYTFVSEPDWALRMMKAGWGVAYVNTVSITHIGGEHSPVTGVKSYPNIMRSYVNRFYFYRKHYSRWQQLLLRPVIAAGASVRVVKFGLTWLLMPARRPEAEPKLRAFARISVLAFHPTPWVLPDHLRRANEVAATGTAALEHVWKVEREQLESALISQGVRE